MGNEGNINPNFQEPEIYTSYPRGKMIRVSVGWYSPYRAGGWRPWLFDSKGDYWPHPGATYTRDMCVLGITLLLEVGW